MEIKLEDTEMINSRNNTGSDQVGSSAQYCMPLPSIASKGLWLGENPLDFPYPLMLAQIILIVVTSRVLYYLLRPLGQTKFVCNLLAGIIMGPSLLGHNKSFRDKLQLRGKAVPLFDTISHLGTVYAVFLITVKFEVSRVKRTAKNGWKIGLVGFLFPSAVTSGFVYTIARTIPGINGGKFFVFFLTFSLSFTYFAVVVDALNELNLMTSELGQLAMSSSAINDVIQWTFTAMHLTFIQKNANNAANTFGSLLAMIVFIVFVIRPIIRLMVKETPEGKEVNESFIIAIQLLVPVMSFISDTIGMKPTMGPLILGLVVPNGPPLGSAIVRKTELLVSEFLLPLFFFRVGCMVDVYSVRDSVTFNKLQTMIGVSYIAKIVGVTVVALCCKIRLKNSLLLSMMMSMKGLIELIIYSQFKAVKAINDQCFTQIVLSSLMMTVIVAPLLRYLYTPLRASKAILPRVRNIQSMPSNFEMFHVLCCFHNEESVPNIITLLEASHPTYSSPICTYVVQAVELIGLAAPLILPCNIDEKKKNKVSNKNTITYQAMRAFENYSKISNGSVIIQGFTMIAPYKCMHETLLSLADDKFVPLIIIPFHENHQGIVGSSMTAAIRQFNANVQSYAACTVGILVDRGLSCRLISLPHFSSNVALFFIGGPDDREALAYAARMSGNPNVWMKVFRITLRNKLKEGSEEEAEAKLDESFVDEFRLRNIGNDRLSWQEIEVDDSVQLMDAVMNLQGNYDLVMVGRRHADMTLRDEEMAEFVENAELGVIGDIVASSDFCGGTVNVLVIQESRELGYGVFCSQFTKESESGLNFMATKRLLP